MNTVKNKIKKILDDVQAGRMTAEEAFQALKHFPYQDLEFAKIDHHREIRKGHPEIIYGMGKSKDHVLKIAQAIIKNGSNLLITKIGGETFSYVKKQIPSLNYNERAQAAWVKRTVPPPGKGLIAIITAGTSDIPVAEEAYVTCDVLGNSTEKIYDVGVAGIHRLFGEYDKIKEARIIITVAGMEGALPSVVAGLTDIPIIAVPTSVGYGASFNGLAALLAMLNSCPGGVAVVNIDNGFGAAYLASLINHQS